MAWSDQVGDAAIGGGNAPLCAAVTAAEAGTSVVVLEHAPRAMRGGNSRHTRTLLAMNGYLRMTGALAVVLAVHLGLVMALFLTLPDGKMVHGLYRLGALARSAAERPGLQA